MSNKPLSATTELCQALIRRPSVTPDDHGCQQLIAERLEKIGFDIEFMNAGNVTNLWARTRNSGPVLVFAGHTDVVPTGDVDQWTHPPFGATIDNGKLYGRGAADMKGGVAAMVTAIERYLQTRSPAGNIALLLTSDEEGPAIDGTAYVIRKLNERSENFDWCIIGEPTSDRRFGDTLKNGRRGSLGAELIIHGKQGHVAYPHQVDNPVHRALQALDTLVRHEWDNGNAFFPATSLQISNVAAGTGATNVTPAEFNVRFNLRFSSELTDETIREKTHEILDRHKLNYTLNWRLSGQPFITHPGPLTDATRQAIKTVCGLDARLDTGGGTSDGRFIATTGAQVIEFGTRNATIHQIDEHVDLDELDQLSDIYIEIMMSLLGGTPST